MLIEIPATEPLRMGNQKPWRIVAPTHYCRFHVELGFDVDAYLTGERKTLIERLAAKVRGPAFKPDFEAARVVPVLVTTPEYRAALAAMGEKRTVIAA